MHRFYVFHSLTQFHRNAIAVAALFLAAKVEEQPRKLEHVIKMAYMCLHRDQPPPDSRSEVSYILWTHISVLICFKDINLKKVLFIYSTTLRLVLLLAAISRTSTRLGIQ